MRTRRDNGAACVELMAMAPMAALMILLSLQLAQLFSGSLAAVSQAQALAARAVRKWDRDNAAAGFKRPCIEEIDGISFSAGGRAITIGVGPLKNNIEISQEVRLVGEPICIPQEGD